jgi:hypothetical protein
MNVYEKQLVQKGYSLSEIRATKAPKREFPCTIGARYFESEAEYNEALADFLNGN